MSRLFPYPVLTAMLLALWLLLQQSIAPGQVLLGTVVATCASLAMAALRPPKAKLRNPLSIVRLVFIVTIDILRSNISVARIVIEGGRREDTSGFLEVPLELTDRYGLAALACIITATPGSAWLEYDPVRRTVLIHVLDLIDKQQWTDTIKNRYERLLLEIFQ
jgi:Multisubunit Na+/H+ antiporter, MnhE subunit